MEMPVRAPGGGGTPLFAHGGWSVAAEGLLRGAKPAVRARQEFSGAYACGGALGDAGALHVACLVSTGRTGQRGAVPRGRQCRREDDLVRGAGACRGGVPRRAIVAREAGHPPAGADYPGGIRTPLAMPLHQCPEGGRAVKRASGTDALLVIVPALNEEGAIGEVVRQIRQHVPGVPVLVIDDCSRDGTI